ncbi:MAG: DUF1707 domain-containing protein [Acidimicrobiales bacterium]|nr:DUF1707 domain-containing protein [Acidimicrobiales bacterium]
MTRDDRARMDGSAVQSVPPVRNGAPSEVPAVVTERVSPDPSALTRAPRPPGREVRIGDRERQEVVDRLREAVGSGHLTLDEFADRVDAAWQAAFAYELAPLTADLPGPEPAPRSDEGAARTPSSDTEESTVNELGTDGPSRSSVIGIMSGTQTRGRWRVAPKVQAFAFWGSACVDLRQALIESPVVDVHATAIMGGVTVIVPEGIPVEMDGCVIMGGTLNRTDDDSVLEGAPVIRVHACGLWGGVEARTRSNSSDDHDHESGVGDEDFAFVPDVGGVPVGTPSRPRHHDRDDPHSRNAENGRVERNGSRPAAAPAGGAGGVREDLPEGTLTIMFTDIVDSTAVVESMGDIRWSKALSQHDHELRTIVGERGGTVVKGNGDGHLVVFPSARQAVLAGIEIRDSAPVTLRVGLHTGEVVRQDGDVYGRNVIAASRIAESADPGDVVVSSLTKDLVESAGDIGFECPRTVNLKGLSQPWTVYSATIGVSAKP